MYQPAVQLDNALWRKSSHSGAEGDCVELAAAANIIAARDSKDPSGPILTFSRGAWRTFQKRISA